MKRVWALDVLECPRCQARMRILAAIHSPVATRKIQDCLGLHFLRFPRRSFRSCGEFHVTDWELDVAELNGSSHSDKLNDGDDHMKEKDDNIAHARMVSAKFCISPPTGAVRCKTHHHDVCAHWSRVNASWASRLFGSARRRMR